MKRTYLEILSDLIVKSNFEHKKIIDANGPDSTGTNALLDLFHIFELLFMPIKAIFVYRIEKSKDL